METCHLITVETNIEELLHGSMVDGDSYDQWYDDFEDVLDKIAIPRMLRYGEYTATFKVDLYRSGLEIDIVAEESCIKYLQTSEEMQRQCVRMMHEMIRAYNEALLHVDMAHIPNAYIMWKNSKFYVEIASGQKEVSIEFNTVQFDDYFDEIDIDWEYLL